MVGVGRATGSGLKGKVTSEQRRLANPLGAFPVDVRVIVGPLQHFKIDMAEVGDELEAL